MENSDQKILRKYINEILKEDENAGQLFRTFIQPVADVSSGIAGGMEELIRGRAKEFLQTVWRNVGPRALSSSYNQISRESKATIQDVRRKYSELFKRNSDALKDDFKLAAFMLDPGVTTFLKKTHDSVIVDAAYHTVRDAVADAHSKILSFAERQNSSGSSEHLRNTVRRNVEKTVREIERAEGRRISPEEMRALENIALEDAPNFVINDLINHLKDELKRSGARKGSEYYDMTYETIDKLRKIQRKNKGL